MGRKRDFMILLLLFFCIATCHGIVQPKGTIQISSLENPICLSGEWQIYYGEHLSASEMTNLNPNDKKYVKIPSNWKKTPIDGKDLPVLGITTYYLQIILPPEKTKEMRSYGFRIGNITSAYKLWINNKLIMQAGNATTTKKGFSPIYYPQSETFSTNTDTLHAVLQVSNFFDINYAGVSQNIYFGKKEVIENLTFKKNAISFFILSLFILLFFFQMAIYIVQKEGQSHVMIAILSLIFLLKMTLDGDVIITHFIPDIPFLVAYRLWLCSFLCIPVVYRLIGNAFPSEMNARVERLVNLFFALAAICFLTFDIHFVMSIIFYVIYVAFASIAYLFYILVLALKNKRTYSVVHIISFSIMILLFINDLIFVTNQETKGYLSQLGVCAYIVTQSMIASIKFAGSQRQALRLSKELERTNLNLERMVQERTVELQDSNIKLEKLNKQKDFLISTISHDLKNAFNTLINYSRILYETIDENQSEQKEISGVLHETSLKSYGILDNILSWARLTIVNQQENTVITNLSDFVKNSIRFFADHLKNKNLTANIDIDDGLSFQCNDGHLDAILRNLLSNAIKFSQPGDAITFSNRLENGFVSIFVHDNGIGIPKEMVQKIFDPNNDKKRNGTTGEEGSGMGLLIVKELVENNQGTITCSSTPNKGTDFTVSFPVFRG